LIDIFFFLFLQRPMSTAVVDHARLRYLPMANAPVCIFHFFLFVEVTINSQVEIAMPGLVPSMNTLRVRLTIFLFIIEPLTTHFRVNQHRINVLPN